MFLTAATFYVYLECENRSYLVAFPSRSSADKFWRIVQTIDPRECRRYSAQNYAVSVLPNQIHVEGWDPQGCLVSRINNEHPMPVLQSDHRPDNINGGYFYIRSILHPKFHWYFNQSQGQVQISKTRQTRFIIRRATALAFQVRKEEDILIGSDDVTISALLNEGQEPKVKIVKDQWNRLVRGNGNGASFKFWLFEGGFYGAYNGQDGPICAVTVPGSGERWEFVA